MRYVLIVNPAAGKKNPMRTVYPGVFSYFRRHRLKPVCHVTKAPGQAAELTAREAEKGGAVRIYGFGGDGTLREIASGAAGRKNAEIGIFPCGSGNDFIKTFGPDSDFLAPGKQLAGISQKVDLIRSEVGDAVNLCSLGLDARVNYEVEKMKKKPFLNASIAYRLAFVKSLFGRLGEDLGVTIDGKENFSGRFLFALAANGKYYGGGFRAAPQAEPGDGLLDFLLIRKPALFKIPRLAGLYRAGLHIGSPEFRDILVFRRGRKMEISAKKLLPANLDGESARIHHITFEAVPHAIRFIVPANGRSSAEKTEMLRNY